MAPEEREQQGPDVRAVDIRVHHQHDAVISELLDVEVLSEAGAERGDQVLDLLVAEDLVCPRLFDVEDLSAQRQDRLVAPLTRALRRPTRRISLDDEDLALRRISLAAVGQLAGQRGRLQEALANHQIARPCGRLARARRGERLFDDAPSVAGILLQILHERVAEHRRHLAGHLAVAQLRLRLSLELRLAQLHADHRGQPVAYVVAGEVGILLLEDVRLPRVLVQRGGERAAESGDVTAALLGVHVVGERQDVFGEGGVLVLQRDLHDVAVYLSLDVHRPGVDRVLVGVEELDVRLNAALEVEGVGELASLVDEHDRDALVEEGIAAERPRDRLPGEGDLRKDLRIGPKTYVRALSVRLPGDGDRPLWHTADVFLAVHLAVAVHLDLEPLAERVHHGQANAVQPTRHLVSAAAELAARVQFGEHDLERRSLRGRMHADRYAAPVVEHRYGVVSV